MSNKLPNPRTDVDKMYQTLAELKLSIDSGQTTYNKAVYDRRVEMSELNKKRTGDHCVSRVKRYEETVEFILKEIQLIRMMEAGLL